MKVLKFGGTSVGSPERMQQVLSIISGDDDPKVVVLSAVSGTTNALEQIDRLLSSGEQDQAVESIEILKKKYKAFIEKLYKANEYKKKAEEVVDAHFKELLEMSAAQYIKQFEKEILAKGELLSTKLFSIFLCEQDIQSTLLAALDFMVIDENHEPVVEAIEQNIVPQIEKNPKIKLYITQGYICRNHKGEVDNLKRGGSDYSATLIGAALQASEVQIWTDIDGMHNNDPRIVEKTFPVSKLSFDEAAELSYFGAKILHPASIWPAQKYGVPVRLLNTMRPEAKGTYISSTTSDDEIKAIAAKDGIVAIKVKSSRMLLAYGFLRKIFEVFEKYKTPIDMITTSEVAVSLTIDDQTYLKEILADLQQFGHVETDKDQTIICIVGAMVSENQGVVRKLFDSIDRVPIRMISYGGSRNNISLLIDSKYKKPVMERLNVGLFSIDLIGG